MAQSLDQTLVCPPRNVAAAQHFMAEGGLFAIATGRTYVTFAPHHQLIPTNLPTILSNGASVYDFSENRLLSLTQLPETAKEDMRTLCQEMPSLAFEAYYGEAIYAHNPNEITDAHMKLVGETYTKSTIEDMPSPWVKVLIQQERNILQTARERLLSLRENHYEAIFSNPRYLEITAKGVCKGTAVKDLATAHNIAPEHIYCVGDNENDLSMLALAKIPFAPSSSAEIVLATKPQILCPWEEGVLGDLITHLEKIYGGNSL